MERRSGEAKFANSGESIVQRGRRMRGCSLGNERRQRAATMETDRGEDADVLLTASLNTTFRRPALNFLFFARGSLNAIPCLPSPFFFFF